MNNEDLQMRQLVLWEMAKAIKEQKPVRLFFAPGTDTHRMISILAVQQNLDNREVVETAVRSMFYAMLAGVQC